MNLGLIAVAVNLTGMALLVFLAALIRRQKLYRAFPFFSFYICCSVADLVVGVLIGLKNQNPALVSVYSLAEALYTLTAIAAMYESFSKGLRTYWLTKKWALLVPLVTTLLILLISVWFLRRHAPVQSDRFAALYFSFYLATDYMLAGLFGLFAALVFFWHARWQRYAFGIMKGFGLFSIVGMLADLLRSQFGSKWDFFFSYAPAVAYILGCLIWLGAFLSPEERKSPVGPGSAIDLDEISQLLGKLTKVIK